MPKEPIHIGGGGGGAIVRPLTLAELTDTAIANPGEGELLSYKDGKWKNTAVNPATGQVQVDWAETDTASLAYIKNKPDLSGGGAPGEDGATFIPSISDGILSWSNDKGLPNPEPVSVTGPTGQAGVDGATFTPSVSAEGLLTWTNDKGLANPAAVNIKGPSGSGGGVAVVNNLASASATDALAAAQGKALDEKKANKPISATFTLTAAGWEGQVAPYTQALDVAGVSPTSGGAYGLSQNSSYEQRVAARAALICAVQGSGRLTFHADGTKPEIDLPIYVEVVN